MERDIEILILQCKNNDRKAQRDLYGFLYEKIFPLIRKYTNNNEHDVAEEIFNNGMLRVYKGLDSYTGSGSFEGWAYRVIKNSMLDHIRANTKYKNNLVFIEKDLVVSKNIIEKISYKELLGLVQELPSNARTVFNLFAIDGHCHKEIGEYLGITEGTSKWHLHQARKMLKEKLENQTKIS